MTNTVYSALSVRLFLVGTILSSIAHQCTPTYRQVDSDGLPILDAGHVLTALNKLDAGDPEELLLSSRDGKDLLVVSYADVQR